MVIWWRWKRYPGFGPWSDLPPWERPGWRFRGRGCWWYYPEEFSKEDEIRMLEGYARYLEEELERGQKKVKGVERLGEVELLYLLIFPFELLHYRSLNEDVASVCHT